MSLLASDSRVAIQATVAPLDPSGHSISTALHRGYSDLASSDLSWVANTNIRYKSVLSKLPQVFSWTESKELLTSLQIWRRSVVLRRWQSTLHHLSLYDAESASTMGDTFDHLAAGAKLRFLESPETFHNISQLRRDPRSAVMRLCTFLNGQAAVAGHGTAQEGYYTALGDVYYSKYASSEKWLRGSSGLSDRWPFRAPHLVDDVPIDVISPNVLHAYETSGPGVTTFAVYHVDEVFKACEGLQNAYRAVSDVSSSAAQLIREFTKVIVPLWSASGYGSTSQGRFPGRVLIRGAERASIGFLASALVHEAMHQLMYVLEWAGEFVTCDTDNGQKIRAQSLWTGCDLGLPSYVHACFVWYGLVKFWTLPCINDSFEASVIESELAMCLSGFRQGVNPVASLMPHAGKVRYDVLNTIAMLQDGLADL